MDSVITKVFSDLNFSRFCKRSSEILLKRRSPLLLAVSFNCICYIINTLCIYKVHVKFRLSVQHCKPFGVVQQESETSQQSIVNWPLIYVVKDVPTQTKENKQGESQREPWQLHFIHFVHFMLLRWWLKICHWEIWKAALSGPLL